MNRIVVVGVFLGLLGAGLGPLAAQRGGCRDDAPSGAVARIADAGEPGERLVLTGRVLDTDGSPRPGVRIRVYQTDASGYYSPGGMDESRSRLCGVLETGPDGGYRVETIRPAAYATGGGPAPHIHLETRTDRGQRLHTVFFPDDPQDGGDPGAGERTARRRPLVRGENGDLAAVFDLRLR